jgi:hypothetical protein
MKTATALFATAALMFASAASAQLNLTALDTSSLQPVPTDQLPKFGTFWIEQWPGIAVPLPFLPADLMEAPVFALPNGQFLVDASSAQGVALAANSELNATVQSPADRRTPQPDPPVVFSNAWFSQIVISNHPYVSVGTAFLHADGEPGNTLVPVGTMFLLTTTNLSVPIAQWHPVGQTNAINPLRPATFTAPYDLSHSLSFYRLTLQVAPGFDTNSIPPYLVVLQNLQILCDEAISLTWTNNQAGNAAELEAIIEVDANGHSYLINSLITQGASGSYWFELPSTNGITFVRHWAPADAPGDQFFVLTNYLSNVDIFTVPYLIDTTSGRLITDVSAYDVTDPQNVQFLARISGSNCFQGTLQIPGVSLYPGVDIIEFRASDAGGTLTTSDVTITNNSLVGIVSPVFELARNSTNQVPASLGSYKVAFEAVTTAVSGTWHIELYNPDGTLTGTATAPVSSIGQDILFDDGGTVSTLYPVPYYEVHASLQGATNPRTNIFWVRLLPPRGNAGSITGYDTQVLPTASGDRQFVLQTLRDGESGMFNFIHHTVDFSDGHWNVVAYPAAISLDANWGWRALQAGLSGSQYAVAAIPGLAFGQWLTNEPDRSILGLAVESHGGEQNGNVAGLQGPASMADSAVTAQTLEEWGFNKKTNAVAIAVLTGCRLGNSSFMDYILRNEGVSGHIDATTATTKGIRPCFGLGWTTETYVGSDQFSWVSYFTLFATQLGGSGSSPFSFSLDGAFDQANVYYQGSGGQGAVWSGTTGATLDQLAQ